LSPDAGGAPVRFEDVTVVYPGSDRSAIDSVSLSIQPSAFTVFVGPSGCGKSTLLRTVNRLVVPVRGTVLVDDEDVAHADVIVLRRSIGYAIQAVGLFSHMTVARNIGIVPELLDWDRSRISARVDELLTTIGLAPARYRNRYPSELSGGEAQRVGVARAIAAQPSVLLMDEPFGAVDALVRATLQDELLRIVRELRTTVLFVTHDVSEALRLADQIVVMREGRIEQHGTPLGVLGRPATPYVRDLFDADDAVRRLSLLHARDAMRPLGTAPSAVTVEANATLSHCLNVLLEGAPSVDVFEDGKQIGTIDIDSLRAALQRLRA
jgi:osmoprotectant transport system ATP-binding protein